MRNENSPRAFGKINFPLSIVCTDVQKYNDQFSAMLLACKESGAINYKTWVKIYPTTEYPPTFMAFKKIHKKDMPVRQ